MKNIIKKYFISLFLILSTVLTISEIYSKNKKNKSEFYKGERNLSYKKRITAEERYNKLAKKLKCVKDKDEIVNQLLYIKNGYYDFGYLPKQKKHCAYKNLPEGFWVYVYPYWFIWKEQKLF